MPRRSLLSLLSLSTSVFLLLGVGPCGSVVELAKYGEPEFACDYLGVVELAKKFGSGALYRLRRANEVE